MTRTTLTFALLALIAITAHAQHFDWVRTYTGPEFSNGYAANEIYGSVMDIGGNVYILGCLALKKVDTKDNKNEQYNGKEEKEVFEQ